MRKLKDSFVTASTDVQMDFNTWSCSKTVCEKTIRRFFKQKSQHERRAAKKIFCQRRELRDWLGVGKNNIYRLTTGQFLFSLMSADSNFELMDEYSVMDFQLTFFFLFNIAKLFVDTVYFEATPWHQIDTTHSLDKTNKSVQKVVIYLSRITVVTSRLNYHVSSIIYGFSFFTCFN